MASRFVAPVRWAGWSISIALLLAAAGFARQGWRGDGGSYGVAAVMAACAVLVATLRVVARAGEGAVVVRLFPFPGFRIPYERIVSVAPMDPATKFAGLGYRIVGAGDVALLTGGPGLTIRYAAPGEQVDRFHPPKELSFSTPDPEGLAGLIAQHRERAATPRG